MRSGTDTVYWKRLISLPHDIATFAWAGPNEPFWQQHDAEELLGATPLTTSVGIWKCRRPRGNETRVDGLKRSFRWDARLYKGMRYSRDLQVGGASIWYDFAVVSMAMASDIALTIQREIGWNTGIVLLQETDDAAVVGGRVADILEDVWRRIEEPEDRVQQRRRGRTIHEPWLDAERARLIHDVPGHLLVAIDSNVTRYLLGRPLRRYSG